jgi:hypothetical protein
MSKFTLALFCLLSLFNLQCGASYWTYHLGNPPAHVGAPTIIPVWVDARFTPVQDQQIAAAIAEWNLVLNGWVKIVLMTHSEPGIDQHPHDYPTTFRTWEAGQTLQKSAEQSGDGWVIYAAHQGDKMLDDTTPEMIAFVRGPGQHYIVIITDRLGTKSLKNIVMHEMAHLLGAQHVSNPSLESNYYDGRNDCIDKITVAQVASTLRIPLAQLSYCVTPDFE